MAFSTLLSCLALSSAVHAASVLTRRQETSQVQWGPCPPNGTVTLISTKPIECTNLTVPLDYTDAASSRTLDLNLLRVPASKQPVKGSILFNFGGPGVGCRKRMTELAETLQVITGGDYDLVTWDPRGTVDTITFRCFETLAEKTMLGLQTGGIGNTTDPTVMGRQWAVEQTRANACFDRPGNEELGSLIGNAFTARDAMQIVDALESDGLLRYWGLSYGTVLGATIGAIFPDRIERMVIDAVLNPTEYYNAFDIEQWSDTDLVFTQFFKECIKAPDNCSLARNHNGTAEELEERAYHLFDELKYRPISWPGGILDSFGVKGVIRPSLYGPSRYPALGSFIDALFTGNVTQISATYAEVFALAPPVLSSGTGDDAPHGIHCADKRTRFDSIEEVFPVIDELSRTSRLSGDFANAFPMACSQWKFDSKERYDSSFLNLTTRNPMLVIGGTYDPATPFRSAVNVSAGFENSVLLQHDGYGHGSLANPSLCTARAIQNYFRDGSLPAPSTLCPVASGPFGNMSWTPYLPQLM